MARINDLISKIDDPQLRLRIEQEVAKMQKQRKFGLVYEEHLPECTPLFDIPVKRGCTVALKAGKISENYVVTSVDGDNAVCEKNDGSHEVVFFPVADLVVVAQFGEPIYPFLQQMDSVCNAPDSDLWHTLIQADNYHALQLLVYLYAGQVDCIYIDPPYNTGARDWKYNNDYVEGADSYRHSKWLSMMEKRLKLAKKLLNPNDSVLIVTIDEKEYLHLGCLLEQMFPESRIQMVSSVINPASSARNNQFGRTDEYIFVIALGNAGPMALPLDSEWYTGDVSKTEKQKAHWDALRRSGTDVFRTDRPNMFFPLYVNKETKIIEEVGNAIELNVNRNTIPEKEGCVSVWPIRKDGSEGRWRVGPETLRKNISKGYVKVGSLEAVGGAAITYLNKTEIERLESGVYPILGYDSYGSIKLGESNEIVNRICGTQWRIKSHNATTYGTNLLGGIIGLQRFTFPKSLYAVHDTIRFFVANKPNALIVDFFAGSGTTLHAVNLLNAEDGGHRRCIMVTNNEVSDEEAKTLSKKGLKPGDKEWESLGIAQYVTWPRTKCSIMGIDVNDKPLEGDYISANTDEVVQKRTIKQLSLDPPEGKAGETLKKQILQMVSKMANTEVLFNVEDIDDFMENIDDAIDTIYVVTANNKDFKEAKETLAKLPEITKSVPQKIPMADGFAANAVFFKLGFLNKTSISLGREFRRILPLLWMKAGAHGDCPSLDGKDVPDMLVLSENQMAILNTESSFLEFAEQVNADASIKYVFIVTDSNTAYRDMISHIHINKTFQLYRDYLDNFRINQAR